MSQVITKRVRLSRRIFLKGLTAAQLPAMVGHSAADFDVQLDGDGVCRRRSGAGRRDNPIQKRFVLWFNGNGIPERYWIPSNTGTNYDITPCLTPIGRLQGRRPGAERARQSRTAAAGTRNRCAR